MASTQIFSQTATPSGIAGSQSSLRSVALPKKRQSWFSWLFFWRKPKKSEIPKYLRGIDARLCFSVHPDRYLTEWEVGTEEFLEGDALKEEFALQKTIVASRVEQMQAKRAALAAAREAAQRAIEIKMAERRRPIISTVFEKVPLKDYFSTLRDVNERFIQSCNRPSSSRTIQGAIEELINKFASDEGLDHPSLSYFPETKTLRFRCNTEVVDLEARIPDYLELTKEKRGFSLLAIAHH